MKINEFNKIIYFKVTAEELSYTNAAKKLEATPSGIQKAVKSLEESLGVKLFIRKFRGLYLTPEGKILLDRAVKSLKELEIAEKELISKSRKISLKKIKIMTTSGMSSEWVYACLPLIRQVYPDVILELRSSNLEVSLETGDVDIYIGPHIETSSNYKAIPLGILHFRLYASKHYLKKHGKPKSIEDLKNHILIKYSESLHAYFSEANKAFLDIDSEENYVFIVDSYLAEHNLVNSGEGIACLSKELVEKKRSEALVDIFPEMDSIVSTIFVYYNKKTDKDVIRTVYDILKENSFFNVLNSNKYFDLLS